MKKSNVGLIALLAALAGFGYISSTRNNEPNRPTPPPESTSQQGCDPNYSGCVPIASDVDCAGGPGDGPAYVSGPINVIGTDIYHLDGDGDGKACE